MRWSAHSTVPHHFVFVNVQICVCMLCVRLCMLCARARQLNTAKDDVRKRARARRHHLRERCSQLNDLSADSTRARVLRIREAHTNGVVAVWRHGGGRCCAVHVRRTYEYYISIDTCYLLLLRAPVTHQIRSLTGHGWNGRRRARVVMVCIAHLCDEILKDRIRDGRAHRISLAISEECIVYCVRVAAVAKVNVMLRIFPQSLHVLHRIGH